MEHVEAELLTDGGNKAVERCPTDGSRVCRSKATPAVLRSEVIEVLEACERGEATAACKPASLHCAGAQGHRSPRVRPSPMVSPSNVGRDQCPKSLKPTGL
ncbi:DUF6959 family protein [Streptomyces sp. NBC_01013]|uniref:DUF6959 family protein n=1 Tax=Streptomyces sp. NBC_01013 TaxID=2903718 RepID=UPI0038647A9C